MAALFSITEMTSLNIPETATQRMSTETSSEPLVLSRSQAYVTKRNGGSGDENGERNTRVKPLRMRKISVKNNKIAVSRQERLFLS